jgi:anaerobic selenocysteine-containing dehydrogenase
MNVATLACGFPNANPAWLHPDDMTELGLTDGDLVRVSTSHGDLTAVAETDPHGRRGTVSMTHGWGGEGRWGSNVNVLVDSSAAGDPISAIPVMSAIPVWVQALHSN